MKPLSYKSIETLKENGYQLRERGDFVSFRQINPNQYVDAVLGIIFIIASWFLVQDYPIIWASIGLILLGIYFTWRRFRLRSLLIFDNKQQVFGFQERSLRAQWFHFEDVDRVSINTKFIEEFEGSLRSEQVHFEITITFILQDNTKIDVMKLKSEFRDPPVAIMDVYNWLVDTVGLKRV